MKKLRELKEKTVGRAYIYVDKERERTSKKKEMEKDR